MAIHNVVDGALDKQTALPTLKIFCVTDEHQNTLFPANIFIYKATHSMFHLHYAAFSSNFLPVRSILNPRSFQTETVYPK